METTTLAQIIGPTLIAAGIGFLLHPKFYQKIVADFEANQGLTYTTGVMIMVLGFVMVLNHNIWEWNAKGIITFMGWATLIKGTICLVVPYLLFGYARMILRNAAVIKVAMVALIIVASYLTYYGYFMV